MTETPPGPADVHTGTDRVELTNDERNRIYADFAAWESNTSLDCEALVLTSVESIVAARVAALTAERDELEHDLNNEAWANEKAKRDLDAARAELAAANARSAELEAENEAKHEAVWGLIAQVADQHVCAECADCLHDGDKCCGCYDNACCRTAALQATLDRVTALADSLDSARNWNLDHDKGEGELSLGYVVRSIRAALTPEGTE